VNTDPCGLHLRVTLHSYSKLKIGVLEEILMLSGRKTAIGYSKIWSEF
jgi:hypothetical protein